MKRAVVHNVVIALNYSDGEDVSVLAEQVINKINELIRTTHVFGLIDPSIISHGHPISLVYDPDDEQLGLPEQAFGD